MLPDGKPVKSAGSQPLVDWDGFVSRRSTPVTKPVTAPGSVWLIKP